MKLRWSPEDFLGITTIRVPSDRIWLPDVVLYDKYVFFIHFNVHLGALTRAILESDSAPCADNGSWLEQCSGH